MKLNNLCAVGTLGIVMALGACSDKNNAASSSQATQKAAQASNETSWKITKLACSGSAKEDPNARFASVSVAGNPDKIEHGNTITFTSAKVTSEAGVETFIETDYQIELFEGNVLQLHPVSIRNFVNGVEVQEPGNLRDVGALERKYQVSEDGTFSIIDEKVIANGCWPGSFQMDLKKQ